MPDRAVRSPGAPAGWFDERKSSRWSKSVRRRRRLSRPPRRSIATERGLVTALTVLFSCLVAAGVFVAIALLHRLSVLDDFESHGFSFAWLRRAEDSDDLVGAAASVYLLLTIATGTVFIVWMFRAAKNHEALARTNPRFGPGWSIGAWFIPFANFVIPVLIMQDLWRGGDPERPRADANWRQSRGSGLIVWWWAMYLAALLVYVDRVDNDNDAVNTVADLKRANSVAALGAVFVVVAAILAILVVRRVTRRQDDCLRVQHVVWQASVAVPEPTA